MIALLRITSLIIWDELTMTKIQGVETLDRYLQIIMDCSDPFVEKLLCLEVTLHKSFLSCHVTP
jgi:hypothetical protein